MPTIVHNGQLKVIATGRAARTMPIEFLCPQCNQLLQTPDDSAGLHAICPQCSLTMLIPDPRASGGPPPIPPPVPSAPVADSDQAAPAQPPEQYPTFVEYQPSPPPSSIPVYESPAPAPGSASGLSNASAGNSGLSAGGSSLGPSSSGISAAARRSGPIPTPAASAPALQRASDSSGSSASTSAPAAAAPFRVHAAMAAGWEVMKANFNTFFIAALVFGISLATVLGFLVAGPILAAGMGAIAVQAARGGKPNVSVLLSGMQDFRPIFGRMLLWCLLMAACQLPFLLLTWALSLTGLSIATTLGGLVMLGACIVVSSRLGWVPFAILEQPQLNFSQLLTHSLDISRGKTAELIKLAAMTYCAMVATIWLLCVGVVLVGIPIAMGIGGATYVLLVRDAS